MKILVTGGAGFIGSHLVDRLLEEENTVICLDDFSTGSIKNIKHHIKNPNFKLINQDATEPYFYEVERIYNLACPASPVNYQKDPIKTTKTNFLGSLNALELAKKTKARILQASTSEVYGDPLEHPQIESYLGNVNPIGIRSCYDEGKRVAESLFFDYARTHKVDIRIARIFNTYGPRMSKDDGRVVSNFITQAIEDKPLTVYGDGSQTRSFCYVSDLVDGLISIMEQENSYGPYNVGNPEEFTLLELINKIELLIGSKLDISFKPLPLDDPKRRKPDITKIKIHTNWSPKIKLYSGLEETYNYFKENYYV